MGSPHPWLLRLVLLGVIFDLAVSVVVGWGAIKANEAASSAHIARVSTYSACKAGNDFRTADLARWDSVLKLVDTMPKDPRTRRFIAGVDAANRQADAVRPCKK